MLVWDVQEHELPEHLILNPGKGKSIPIAPLTFEVRVYPTLLQSQLAAIE